MTEQQQRTTVGVTASFTPQLLLRPMLEAYPGSDELETVVADFNQVHQTLMDPAGSFETNPDRLVVLWRVEDVFEASLTEWLVGSADASGLVEDVRQLGALVAQAARDGGVPVLVSTPPFPHLHWLDPLDTRTSARLAVLHGQLLAAFLDGIGEAPLTLVDFAALLRVHGVESAYDTRNDLMYHQPFTSRFAQHLGSLLGEALGRCPGRPRRSSRSTPTTRCGAASSVRTAPTASWSATASPATRSARSSRAWPTRRPTARCSPWSARTTTPTWTRSSTGAVATWSWARRTSLLSGSTGTARPTTSPASPRSSTSASTASCSSTTTTSSWTRCASACPAYRWSR